MTYANSLSLLVIAFLIWFIYGPWQKLWIDWARERMFASRDEIFIIAAEGGLSFDSEEYRVIRTAIESLIRYTHKVSFLRFVLLLQISKEIKNSRPNPMEMVIRIQNDQVRDRVRRQLVIAVKSCVFMMILRSPILWLPAFVVFILREVFGQRTPPSIRSLGRVIVRESQINDEARVVA